MSNIKKVTLETRLIHGKGALYKGYNGSLSFPVYRCSTIKFGCMEDLKKASSGINSHHGGVTDVEQIFDYGRRYNPTSYELSTLLAMMEFDDKSYYARSLLFPSGVLAISIVIQALCNNGGSILVPSDSYAATRDFVHEVLYGFGVKIIYYSNADELGELLRDDTRLIFCENPSSVLFRFYDIEKIVSIARGRGIFTLMDNSWASCAGFQPLEFGFDAVVYSATKYVGGHSDVLMGVMVTGNKKIFSVVNRLYVLYGIRVSPDECFLIHRGLKTLAVRCKQHQENAVGVVDYLSSRSEVRCVFYPSTLPEEQHSLWARHYRLSNGLFTVIFDFKYSFEDLKRFVDGLSIFNLGLSWGGCNSAVLIINVKDFQHLLSEDLKADFCVRMFCGLEDVEDLIGDIRQSLDRL